MITDILLSAGLPAIDENLTEVIVKLRTFGNSNFGAYIWQPTAWAWIFAYIMISWEFIKMIGGQGSWQLARYLRPIGMMLALSLFTVIAHVLEQPGQSLGTAARAVASASNKEVQKEQHKVDSVANLYKIMLNVRIASFRALEKAAAERRTQERQLAYKESTMGKITGVAGDVLGGFTKVMGPIGSAIDAGADIVGGAIEQVNQIIGDGEEDIFTSAAKDLNAMAKTWVVTMETSFAEMVNEFIKFISELTLQMMYYGMLVLAEFGRAVLFMFGPVAFAISILPPFSDAWSTWIARWVNLSLYTFLIFMCVSMVDQMFMVTIGRDLTAYEKLLKGLDEMTGQMDWAQIGQLGLNSLGSTAAYIGSTLAGAYALKMVPEVASWIMPAGAASGISAAASGFSKIIKV